MILLLSYRAGDMHHARTHAASSIHPTYGLVVTGGNLHDLLPNATMEFTTDGMNFYDGLQEEEGLPSSSSQGRPGYRYRYTVAGHCQV